MYFVYVVECEKNIKIGIASDPLKRLSKMQTGNPFKMHFRGAVPVRDKHVADLVEKLAHKHYRKSNRRGEWFYGLRSDDVIQRVHDFAAKFI